MGKCLRGLEAIAYLTSPSNMLQRKNIWQVPEKELEEWAALYKVINWAAPIVKDMTTYHL